MSKFSMDSYRRIFRENPAELARLIEKIARRIECGDYDRPHEFIAKFGSAEEAIDFLRHRFPEFLVRDPADDMERQSFYYALGLLAAEFDNESGPIS